MAIQRWRQSHTTHWLLLFLLGMALVLAACAPIEPSRWEEAQETTAGQSATAKNR